MVTELNCRVCSTVLNTVSYKGGPTGCNKWYAPLQLAQSVEFLRTKSKKSSPLVKREEEVDLKPQKAVQGRTGLAQVA